MKEAHVSPVAADAEGKQGEESLPLSHFVHVLARYRAVILVSILSVLIGYSILAVAIWMFAPSRRITTAEFRLDFGGAESGVYPNGLKFSTNDIIAAPILMKVHAANNLQGTVPFNVFSRSIVVLEANHAYDRLVAEYRAKLADPKLTPVDRGLIEAEFDQKRAAISKSDYAISYVQERRDRPLSPMLARKVLLEVLSTWAHQAAVDRRVLQYRVAILTDKILDRQLIDQQDVVISLTILREKVNDVLRNIDELMKIPGAELVRTKDQMSLVEIALSLRDTIRFQIEPAISGAIEAGTVKNRTAVVHILETQLAFDKRALEATRSRELALRNSLAAYERTLITAPRVATEQSGQRAEPQAETVMPQIGEGFIDRVLALANRSGDREYRQARVDDIREAALDIIPAQSAVSYDEQILGQFLARPASGHEPAREALFRAQLESAYGSIARAVRQVNEIYVAVSRQLNPVTELYSLRGPVTERVERSTSLSRIVIYGVLLTLISIPLIIILSLLHARVREEERQEAEERPPQVNTAA